MGVQVVCNIKKEMYHSESNSHVMCGSGGGPTAVGRGAGVGGETMCEDLRPGRW